MFTITYFIQTSTGLRPQVWDTYPTREAAEAELEEARVFIGAEAFRGRLVVRKARQ